VGRRVPKVYAVFHSARIATVSDARLFTRMHWSRTGSLVQWSRDCNCGPAIRIDGSPEYLRFRAA